MRKAVLATLVCLAMLITAMPAAAGQIQFGHTWGTAFEERAWAVEVDSSGNVLLAGTIRDSGPLGNASFVAKVDVLGHRIWDIILSSPSKSLYLYDSALGPSNSLYVVGQYWTLNGLETGTFYAKISSSGALVYQKYLPGLTTANRICTGAGGSGFVIVGDVHGYGGAGAVVAVKDDGTVNWALSGESPDGESPWAAVTDSSGAVYTFQDSINDSNVAIAKFSKVGHLVKQRVLLTEYPNLEYTWDLAIGHDGNIYALGADYGNNQLLLASFTPKLELIWDEYVRAPLDVYDTTRLVVAADGSLYAVGYQTWNYEPVVFHLSTSGAVLDSTMFEPALFFGSFGVDDACAFPSGGVLLAGSSYGFPKIVPTTIENVVISDVPNVWTDDTTTWAKLTLSVGPGDAVTTAANGVMDDYGTSQGLQAWYGIMDPAPPAFKSSMSVKTTQNPYLLSFKAEASGGRSPYTYGWYFGDGFKASGPKVSHEYAMGGIYQVFLVVTDAKGLVSWTTTDVSLPAYPVITSVTHYPDPAYVGETVSFEVSAYDPDGGSLSYLWSFGDGVSNATLGPFAYHSYAAQGVYDCSVTVTDDEGLAVSALIPVTILPVPQPLGWTPLTIPSGHYINLVGIDTPYGRGIHVDSIGSSDYAYQMMGVNSSMHTASATGEIKVSGYFRQYDDLYYYDQPGRRFVRVYALDPFNNGTVLAVSDALDYTYLVNVWYHRDVVLSGLMPWSSVKIGIGRADMWLIDWSLTAEWAGVEITPFETNHSMIVAEAGPTQYLWGQNTVTLNGSGSHADAGIVSYVWTWVAGNGTNKSVTGVMPSFPAEWFFSYGNYTITLMVTDSEGNIATDTTNVDFGFRIDYDTPMGAEQCYAPSDGYFKLRIENHGMTSFDWTIVSWNLTGPPYEAYNATVTLPGTGIYVSDPFWMSAGGHIQSEYVPTGPVGSYFIVYSYFVPLSVPSTPPSAWFNYTVDGSTVNVDGSGSSAATGIVSYTWNWGDGSSIETFAGPFASHTYAAGNLTGLVGSLVSSQEPVVGNNTPPPPYPVVGYVTTLNGTPVLGCNVLIANLRTGGTANTTTDLEYGIYMYDLGSMEFGWMSGDVIQVLANDGVTIGVGQGVANVSTGYLWIDVVLGSIVPTEHYTVTLTVTDMLGHTDSIAMEIWIRVQ